MNLHPILTVAALSLAATPLVAQGPAFASPGQPGYSTLGQTTRFSTEFNPAIGFVVDAFGDYVSADVGSDGFDATFRLLELNAAAYVDPDAWAYVVLTSEDLEAPGVEEAAVEYIGLESTATVTAGRFFVDFGKQMDQHLEELRTLDRPLVLREYLGEELAGTGIQVDHWFALDDVTPVRWSLGVFASLAGEGHDHGGAPGPVPHVPERKDFDELSFAGRVTGMRDVGERGQVQVGVSGRFVPEFAFEDEVNAIETEGLSNSVLGADVTFGCTDDTGLKRLACGGEILTFDGDLSAETDTSGPLPVMTVVNDRVTGGYVFVDAHWNERDSGGVQYSWLESPEDPTMDESELDLYMTRHLTENRRLRLGVTAVESDLAGDSTRFYVQFTAFFGSHSHGVNW